MHHHFEPTLEYLKNLFNLNYKELKKKFIQVIVKCNSDDLLLPDQSILEISYFYWVNVCFYYWFTVLVVKFNS